VPWTVSWEAPCRCSTLGSALVCLGARAGRRCGTSVVWSVPVSPVLPVRLSCCLAGPSRCVPPVCLALCPLVRPPVRPVCRSVRLLPGFCLYVRSSCLASVRGELLSLVPQHRPFGLQCKSRGAQWTYNRNGECTPVQDRLHCSKPTYPTWPTFMRKCGINCSSHLAQAVWLKTFTGVVLDI